MNAEARAGRPSQAPKMFRSAKDAAVTVGRTVELAIFNLDDRF